MKPGTKLADIRTVRSYPHAAAQCRAYLARKVPKATFEAANSTADAAARSAGRSATIRRRSATPSRRSSTD